MTTTPTAPMQMTLTLLIVAPLALSAGLLAGGLTHDFLVPLEMPRTYRGLLVAAVALAGATVGGWAGLKLSRHAAGGDE